MKRVSFAVAALLALSVAYAGGRMMKEGQWEVTAQTEMEGMPQRMPPHSFTKCVKPEDVKKPEDMLKNSQQSEDCTQKDVKAEGNKVTWTVECHKHGGTQTGHGEISYAGESYEGTITVEMNDPRFGQRKVVTHLKGRRTGDCPAQ